MATPKRPKIPDAKDFVCSVAEHLGADRNVDLARKMGWPGAQAPGNIGRWRAGISKPNYENTMEMLKRCGWLNLDAASEVTVAASDDVPEVTQPQLSDLLESLDRIEQILRSRLDEPPTETQSA